MTKLTTHVLDTYSGKPGARIKVELYYLKDNNREKKNTDGSPVTFFFSFRLYTYLTPTLHTPPPDSY